MKTKPRALVIIIVFLGIISGLLTVSAATTNDFSLENPYKPAAFDLKTQLHCHTTLSDGKQNPDEVLAAYKKAGYDSVCITDHNFDFGKILFITQLPQQLTLPEGPVLIPGMELSPNPDASRVLESHILGIGLKAIPRLSNPQEMLNALVAQGALPIIAHPSWKTNRYEPIETLEALTGYLAIELDDIPKWDFLLSKGKRIFGILSDDMHDITGIRFNKQWVIVRAKSNRLESILEALKSGNFYASNGPKLSIKVQGKKIYAETDKSATIDFIVFSGYLAQRATKTTTASYEARGNEVYIRVRIYRQEDKGYAYSNPIWLRK